MNYTRAALSALGIVSLASLTGCHRVILVSPNQIGPIWSTGRQLVWQKRAKSPAFLVYVVPGVCKESLPGAAKGPNGTYALPQADTVTCTLVRGTKDKDIVYYISFPGSTPSPTGSQPGEPPLVVPPEGPFAARVGSCHNC